MVVSSAAHADQTRSGHAYYAEFNIEHHRAMRLTALALRRNSSLSINTKILPPDQFRANPSASL